MPERPGLRLLKLWRLPLTPETVEDPEAAKAAACGPELYRLVALRAGGDLDWEVARAYLDASHAKMLCETLGLDPARFSYDLAKALDPDRLAPPLNVKGVSIGLDRAVAAKVSAAEAKAILDLDLFGLIEWAVAGRLEMVLGKGRNDLVVGRHIAQLLDVGPAKIGSRNPMAFGAELATSRRALRDRLIRALADGELVAQARRAVPSAPVERQAPYPWTLQFRPFPHKDYIELGGEKLFDVHIFRAEDEPANAGEEHEPPRRYPAPKGYAERVSLAILDERKLDLLPLGLEGAAAQIASLIDPPRKMDTVRRYIGGQFRALRAAAARAV